MNSPYGKPIVTNAAMQILLKQAPSAVDALQKAFNLTEGEKFLLLNAGVGQGVFFAGRKHVAIQIVASPKEHEIVTTNPEELSRRKAQVKAEKAQDMERDAAAKLKAEGQPKKESPKKESSDLFAAPPPQEKEEETKKED